MSPPVARENFTHYPYAPTRDVINRIGEPKPTFSLAQRAEALEWELQHHNFELSFVLSDGTLHTGGNPALASSWLQRGELSPAEWLQEFCANGVRGGPNAELARWVRDPYCVSIFQFVTARFYAPLFDPSHVTLVDQAVRASLAQFRDA